FFLNLFITIRFTDVIDNNLNRIMAMETDDFITAEDTDPNIRGFNERVFIIYFDEDYNITETKVMFPDLIDEETANEYATTAVIKGDNQGWSDNYRYLIGQKDNQTIVIFIDGDFFAYAITSFRNISLLALGVTTILVSFFIYFASKQAVKPIVKSYERQKQFMTDASHELKTPLTVISANTEILKMNNQNNEWVESIQKQTHTLTHLIQQIIRMSKLDESELELLKEEVDLSEMILEEIDDFSVLIKQKQIELTIDIQPQIHVFVNHQSIKELISILLDNAVKYCDEQGDIQIKLFQNKKTHIWISNQYMDIDKLNTDSMFDRFYRGDTSRKSDGSFGLGLSIASSITELHQGTISAKKLDQHQIVIEVILP
ncbi:MAG: HAMP domain-containing sensor histidine kinase, partial [Acholeplasmataceae bacterium]